MAQARRRSKPTPKKGGRLRSLAAGISGQGAGWTKVVRWIAFLSVAGILAGALTFFVLYRAIAIPDPNADFLTQTTTVYYSDGKHKIGTFANQDRESIPLSEIPASMQAAAIAAEDRSFYENRGIDFKGILRALRDNTTSGEITGGGSTITQQYVKILYLTQERSYTRKVKEAILSIKIHNQLSKKEILEGYLNTIYFGNGAYGVQVASQTYFGKPAAELDYAESAFLATIINSPSYYDPYVEGAKERILPRYNYVLDGMLKSGAITQAEREEYRDKLPKFVKKKISNRFGGTNGYLLDMVKKELIDELDFTEGQVTGGGYKIITSFDYERQKAAVAAVKANKPDKDELNTALVSVEPGTGAVQALYGGPDFVEKPFNWATQGTQPGSTFKVFAVIAALEDGYSLKTQLNGSPFKVGNFRVQNQGDSGGAAFGKVSLERATQKSINTAFVDLTLQMGDDNVEVGARKVLDAAVEAGIPQSVVDKISPVAVTSLGYAPVAPIDMANAYATVAAGGERAEWFVVDKVSSDDQTLYEHKVKTKRTITEAVAGDTIKALRSVVGSGGTGTRGRTICPTGGKTGTATAGSETDQHVSSSWFAGITPHLATAVMYNRGVGNENLEGYMIPFYGGTIPAMTFRSYMNEALEGTDCGSFVKPGNIKADKGTEYKEPPPKCKSNEMLNDKKDACVPRPVPTCDVGEVLNPDQTACIPSPSPTPTPTTPTSPSPTSSPSTPPPAESLSTGRECRRWGYSWQSGGILGSGECVEA